MSFAICNETFQGWTWADTCRATAEIGYNGIEIAPFTLCERVTDLDRDARREIRTVAERAGLEIVGLHWLLLAPKGLSLTADDPGVRATTAHYLAALAEFCADVGGRTLVLGSPQQRRIPEGRTTAEAVDRLIACLEPALQVAERAGLTLCLEPLPGPEADLILTLAEAVAVIERVAHPNLRTIFDVKSACSEGTPLPELIRRYAGQIAHVHANDANRRGPGFGEVDFHPILTTLREVGYAGFVSVEVFDYTLDPETIAKESLRYMSEYL
jgi:sugar phosphate isomerase/epimerase